MLLEKEAPTGLQLIIGGEYRTALEYKVDRAAHGIKTQKVQCLKHVRVGFVAINRNQQLRIKN